MSRLLDERAREFDAPPWEQFGRSLDGRGGFFDSMSLGAVRALPSPVSRAVGELKSGLTRRGVIYEYIRGHPGVHVRAMAKDLRLATGDLQYHLAWLESHGYAKTKKTGFYRFVYPTMVFKEDQEVLLGVLSQKTPREILLCLLLGPDVTQGQLARRLAVSQPTISWHMDRLCGLGVVSKTRTGREIAYEVRSDRDDILKFVKEYHRGVWKRWVGMHPAIAVSSGVKGAHEERALRHAGWVAPAVVELIGTR